MKVRDGELGQGGEGKGTGYRDRGQGTGDRGQGTGDRGQGTGDRGQDLIRGGRLKRNKTRLLPGKSIIYQHKSNYLMK